MKMKANKLFKKVFENYQLTQYIMDCIRKKISPNPCYESPFRWRYIPIRKQTFLAYYKYLSKLKFKWRMFAIIDNVQYRRKSYKTMSNRDILKMSITEEYYFDDLKEIRDFMKAQFEDYMNENYETNPWRSILAESTEFDVEEEMKYRTYEFEVFMEDREEQQFYLRYSRGRIIDLRMWWSFNYPLFMSKMMEIGTWER